MHWLVGLYFDLIPSDTRIRQSAYVPIGDFNWRTTELRLPNVQRVLSAIFTNGNQLDFR